MTEEKVFLISRFIPSANSLSSQKIHIDFTKPFFFFFKWIFFFFVPSFVSLSVKSLIEGRQRVSVPDSMLRLTDVFFVNGYLVEAGSLE